MLSNNECVIKNNNLTISNFNLGLWQASENYTTLGSKQIKIEKVDANHAYARKVASSNHWLKTTLKVISYITVLFPLIALLICSINRRRHPLVFSAQAEKGKFGTTSVSLKCVANGNSAPPIKLGSVSVPPPEMSTDQFIRQQLTKGIEEDKLAHTDVLLPPIEKDAFIELCVFGDYIDRRYALYNRIHQVKSVYHNRMPGCSALAKKLKSVEMYLRSTPKDNLDTLERFLEIIEELGDGSYEDKDVVRLFETAFSIFKIHPTRQDISTYFKEIDFIDSCSEFKDSKKHLATSGGHHRRISVLTNEANDNFAKVAEANQREVAAYRLTQLLGTHIVPMTLKSREGETVQRFIDTNVKLLYDFLNENADAAEILSSVSAAYLHLYLLQTILIGQADGHLSNTFVELDEEGAFKELIDFDNEYCLYNRYYAKGEGGEGRGAARIALMGLGQAKQVISRALLRLMVAPEFQRKMLHFFENKGGYSAAKERLSKLKKIAQFSLDHQVPVSFEDIYFTLFTHEDLVNRQREYGVPDLVNFVSTSGYSDQCISNARGMYRGASPLFFQNLDKLPKPEVYPLRTDRYEQYGGQGGMSYVREWLQNPFADVTSVPVFEKLLPQEIDVTKYKGSTDPVITSLCLKGTPGIVARRISKEFPDMLLRIVKVDEEYSLVLELNENMKQAKKNIEEKKERVEVDRTFRRIFKRDSNLQFALNSMSYGIGLNVLDSLPESEGKWTLFQAGNLLKKNYFKVVKSEGKYFLKIDWEQA